MKSSNGEYQEGRDVGPFDKGSMATTGRNSPKQSNKLCGIPDSYGDAIAGDRVIWPVTLNGWGSSLL